MSMENLHCDMFELYFQFNLEDIDRDAFLREVNEIEYDELTDDEGNFDIGISFGSREQPPKLHAHLRVRFFKDKKSRIELSYHRSPMTVDDVKPPYAEECAQWLGGFFKDDKIETRINAAFTFDKSYSPVIPLPFPFVSREKALTGALVMGLSLLIPKDGADETYVIQKAGDETFIFLNTKTEVSLRSLDLPAEVGKVSVTVNSLVNKQEAEDESSGTQKDE